MLHRTELCPAIALAGLGLALACVPARAAITPSGTSLTLSGAAAQFGTSVAVAGDVNGDGYSDLIVGAPNYSNGQSNEGRVLVYLGGPSGFAASPSWTFESNVAGAHLGKSVAPAGDVNGDGYADVIVGAPNLASNSLTNNGRAYVFLGGPTGLASTPAWTFDGTQAGELLGWSVCTAGDVDRDGYDDVLVGSPNYGNIVGPQSGPSAMLAPEMPTGFNNGRVQMFRGGPSGPATSPSWTHYGFQAGSAFGFSVATAGDVTGDGYDDVVVGAPYGANLFTGDHEAGEIDVFHGGPGGLPSTPSVTRYGSQVNELLGYSVATAGDVDGDGYADIVVGAPGHTNAVASQGAVYVYAGSGEGIQGGSFPIEGPVASTSLPGGQFGYSVAPAGDINGDGYADFVAGAPFYSTNGVFGIYVGYFAVYEGTPVFNSQVNGLHASLAASSSDGHGSELGFSVCAAGDGDGDGFGDVVVGAPTAGSSDGRVLVFRGTADVPSTVPGSSIDYPPAVLNDMSLPYPIPGGDIDGDGYGDLMIHRGAHGSGSPSPTITEFFRGGPSGLGTSVAWTLQGSDLDPTATYGFTLWAGDVNGDGYDDLAITVGSPPHGYVVAGSASGPVLPPLVSLGPVYRLFPIGDVNGDGFADLMGFPHYAGGTDTVRIYLGGPVGPSPIPSQVFMADQWNIPAPYQILGDYNGDGYDDVLIGNIIYTGAFAEEGLVQLYLGSASGVNTTPTLTLVGTAANDHISPWPVGDLNGDGLADFATYGQSGLKFYYGNNALPTVALGADEPSAPPAYGDFNDDGFGDVILLRGGVLQLYLGSPTGISTSPSATLSVPQYPWEYYAEARAQWGRADFNGDGFDDSFNTAQTFSALDVIDTCHVQILYGNSSLTQVPGLDRVATQRRSDDASRISIQGISDAASQFRIASHGRSAAGRTRVRMESDVKNWGVAFESDLGKLSHDAWSATGDPGANGTFAALDAVRALPASTPTDKWRMRIASHSPYFPWTPWLSPAGNERTEYDLRNASSAAGVSVAGGVPAHLEMSTPSPNPSRGETRLTFALPRRSSVELGIYDLAGRRVATLAGGPAEAGRHEVTWAGRTDSGRAVGPGMYFARLVTEGQRITRKIVRAE